MKDWAKTTPEGLPGISVRQHCMAVRCVAEELLRRFPCFCTDNGIAEQAVAFLAAAHDVGKISLDFLQQCPAWLQQEGLERQARNGAWKSLYTRWHPRISQQSLQCFLEAQGYDLPTAYYWAAVVGAHHGRLLAAGGAQPCCLLPRERKLEPERQACLLEFWEACDKPTLPPVGADAPCLWSVAGLVTLADWIGSDSLFFPVDEELAEDALRHAAAEAVEAIGLGLPPVRDGLDFAALFPGKSPYPMQLACAEAISGPGVYVLEAPMGMGKTEAALLAAYNLLRRGLAQGVFFALPTQATSNRMFLRLHAFAAAICPQAAPTQLVHGNSWLCDDLKSLSIPGTADAPRGGRALQADAFWFSSSRRALFAPFGVGTVDQALLAVLAVKHFPLRRFALSRKVVILDEVHTYDVYTGTLIRHLCVELEKLGCTVIILSATLTEGIRRQLLGEPSQGGEDAQAPYPRLTGRAGGLPLVPRTPPTPVDKKVRVIHAAAPEARQQAIDCARKGAQVLWVCDTVDSAQETWQALRREAGDAVDLGLLHARFPFFRRTGIEEAWMERFGAPERGGRGAILVSTQIVEQSVDLDADALFSELAPTDMLLQRLGRLWRHTRQHRPLDAPLFCLLEEGAPLETLRDLDAPAIKAALGARGFVYKPYVLLRTLEQWATLDAVSLPAAIRGLMAATYAPADCPPAWQALEMEQWGTDLAARTIADMGTNIWQSVLDDVTIPGTRLSDHEDCAVVLCREDNGSSLTLLEGGPPVPVGKGPLSLGAAKALHRNAVRLGAWHFARPPQDARVQPCHLQGVLLVGDDGRVQAQGLKPGRRIFWDTELGLVVQKELP